MSIIYNHRADCKPAVVTIDDCKAAGAIIGQYTGWHNLLAVESTEWLHVYMARDGESYFAMPSRPFRDATAPASWTMEGVALRYGGADADLPDHIELDATYGWALVDGDWSELTSAFTTATTDAQRNSARDRAQYQYAWTGSALLYLVGYTYSSGTVTLNFRNADTGEASALSTSTVSGYELLNAPEDLRTAACAITMWCNKLRTTPDAGTNVDALSWVAQRPDINMILDRYRRR